MAELDHKIEIGTADWRQIDAAHRLLKLTEIIRSDGGRVGDAFSFQIPACGKHAAQETLRNRPTADTQQKSIEQGAQSVIFRQVVDRSGEKQSRDRPRLAASPEDT